MKEWLRIFAVVVSLGAATKVVADPGPLELWSPTPAVSWNQEAYPIGNGKLAAMIFGIVGAEQIQFNEETVWCGQPNDYSNPNATPAHLASIRASTFARNDTAIWNEAKDYLMSYPLRQAHYQPTGVLNLNFAPHSGTANYRRTLDLNTGTVIVRYDYNGVTYTREYFASNPTYRCLIVRLTASQAARINFTATFTTLQPSNTISTSGSDLILNAKVSNKPDAAYWVNPPGMTNAIEFQARVRVLHEGGTLSSTSSSITVANADAVTLLLSAASNYKNFEDLSNDETLICSNNIANAATNTYAALRAMQLADYQSLFNRVVLDLGPGNSVKTNMPTGQRIKLAGQGDDHQLSTIYFQMGRYLTIAGSRPGSHPLNLQGKWNDLADPNWESKHTLNVNQFLNYSGTEMANLSECHQPMFDLIADLAITGARVASNIYYSRGWVVHHNTDLWRGAAPINGRDGIWPAGQAWLAQNLWWHYQYTGDTNYLANTAYPLMKGAAQFFQDFLIPHATNANWLVTCPSYSSEHNWESGSIEVANVPGPTMDNELIRELCDYLIQSTHILGIDAEFRTNLITLRAKLPPNKIGQHGQLQEWIEDVDSPTDTHRHCSHLVGLYPGETISPYYTPTMAAAAKVSTDARCSLPSTDIGWGHAWRIGLQARLQNNHFTYLFVTNLLQRHVSTNLMFTDGVNRQVDGIFGSLGSVCETMLQSQWGELHLLPAVPAKWTNGFVSGLRARGGFEVGITWTNNRLASADVKSLLGNTCRVRSRWPIDVKLGSNYVAAPMIYPGVYQFATLAGSNYTIVPATIYEAENLAASTSAGDAHAALTNGAFSNLRGTRLSANAANDFVTYALTNVPAGNWRVRVVANCATNHARIQLSLGPTGSLSNLGAVFDTYSATNVAGLYPSNGLSSQLLWTNMLKEFDCGEWTAPTNGNYEFKFTVGDKNANSSGYWLSFDHIKLTPAQTTIVAPVTPPTLTATLAGGEIILSWPTNAWGFGLESATNLLAPVWIGVLPSPPILNTNHVVTNAVNAEQKFYRLHHP
jgi:alpha-L-fucosidase 2